MIYLEAGYSYAFDDGQGACVMDMMALHAPQPPPPGPKDLATFGALEKYYERANGFRTPGAELRQEYQSGPDGAVGKQHNVPGGAMLMTLLKHPDGYSRVPRSFAFHLREPA